MTAPSEPAAQNERITAVFAEHRGRLRAFARRQLGDALEAEEIVQDVFYELILAYRLMQPIEHLAGWLMGVARNRIIDRFRARAKARRTIADPAGHDGGGAGDHPEETASFLESMEMPTEAGPEAAYARARLGDVLEAALAELPSEQRHAFVAHEFEGLSIREIAAEQGVPVNTLLWRKRAAVLHLRERLRDMREAVAGE